MNREREILRKLKIEVKKAENERDILIQSYIDTVEENKLITIEREYNKQCKVIKALNKRLTLLKECLNE